MIGPLIGAQEVCTAVEDTLTAWFPSVTAEIANAGGPTLPVPTTYDLPDPEALKSGNAELPAVVVSSTGLVGTPVWDEDMSYRATWQIIVSVFARGDDYRSTAAQVRGFALAARVCLTQHPDLGGLASELVWVGEEYAALLESRAARTIGAGYVTFNVTVDGVTDADAGPLLPPAAPDLITEGVEAISTDLTVEEMA